MPTFDVAVIGGGIVGLATARELLTRSPALRLIVLEKESQLAAHQTGHNSGVIHSGVYYRPGSLKAQTCGLGARLLVAFCQAQGIPYTICGKLIVATTDAELPTLRMLYERATANGVPGVVLIGPEQLREREPHAAGLRALHVPSAGVVDYRLVAHALAALIVRQGGEVRTSVRVDGARRLHDAWVLATPAGEVQARHVVTCGGLHADRLAAMMGAPRNLRIIPFRGEYYNVVAARRGLVKTMLYPVPNPALPFLGVHFTRAINGTLHAGPNAVLAFRREGYRKTDVDLREILGMVGYIGFWRMAATYWRSGVEEFDRSMRKPAFVQALQRLVPDIRPEDLVPGDSGVRAQAVAPNGGLVDDFDIVRSPHATHVRNVPSPAATASLCLAQTIANHVAIDT